MGLLSADVLGSTLARRLSLADLSPSCRVKVVVSLHHWLQLCNEVEVLHMLEALVSLVCVPNGKVLQIDVWHQHIVVHKHFHELVSSDQLGLFEQRLQASQVEVLVDDECFSQILEEVCLGVFS